MKLLNTKLTIVFIPYKQTKDSDGMEIIVIVVTSHRPMDRTEIVQKSIDDFNNSVHLSLKSSKKMSKFSLTSHIQKSMKIKESVDS